MRTYLIAAIFMMASVAHAQTEEFVAFKAVWEGKVQGVGFRAFVTQEARNLEVKGWIANIPDGTVWANMEGKRESVSRLIGVSILGPKGSRITRMKIEEIPVRGAYSAFKMK
jgi:acylphosphatase